MDRSKRYLERGLTGRGARRKQGAQDKTLRALPRSPACPRGWVVLPFAEIKEDWVLGRVHDFSLGYVEFGGSLRFQRRDTF